MGRVHHLCSAPFSALSYTLPITVPNEIFAHRSNCISITEKMYFQGNFNLAVAEQKTNWQYSSQWEWYVRNAKYECDYLGLIAFVQWKMITTVRRGEREWETGKRLADHCSSFITGLIILHCGGGGLYFNCIFRAVVLHFTISDAWKLWLEKNKVILYKVIELTCKSLGLVSLFLYNNRLLLVRSQVKTFRKHYFTVSLLHTLQYM